MLTPERFERLRAVLDGQVPEFLRFRFAEMLHEPLEQAIHALTMADHALGGPDPEAGVEYLVDALTLLVARLDTINTRLSQ